MDENKPNESTEEKPKKPTKQNVLDKAQIKDDQGLMFCWTDLVENSNLVYQNKTMPVAKLVAHVKSLCLLPADMNIADVRKKEIVLGNLLASLSTEMALTGIAKDILTEHKKDYLSEAKDKRKTQAVIEAELVRSNEEYKMARNIWLSADINHRLLKSLYTMITDTLDRVKQISITLTAEMKMDPYGNNQGGNAPSSNRNKI